MLTWQESVIWAGATLAAAFWFAIALGIFSLFAGWWTDRITPALVRHVYAPFERFWAKWGGPPG